MRSAEIASASEISIRIGKLDRHLDCNFSIRTAGAEKMDPKIGIWWDNGKKIVAFPVPAGKPDSVVGICDSEDSHIDRWPDVAIQLGANPADEYYSIPRGRVLYDTRRKTSIIYHGNQTDPRRLSLIAKEFGLVKWVADLDGHYMMGAAADDYFLD
jgi:hypothetical protein